MHNILILGFGNLGKRYLQAILNLKIKKNIFIYDKILKKKRLENQFDNFNNVYFCKSLEKINVKKIDLCISAMISYRRLKSLKDVKKMFIIKNFILEKVLEQNPANIKQIYYNLGKSNAWVNLPFSCMDFFKVLKKKISNKAFFVEVYGNNWGLASNIWHYTFFYGKLFQSRIQKIEFLNNSKFIKSKRLGFKEIIGGVNICYCNGKQLKLLSTNTFSKLSIKHKVKNNLDKEFCRADEISKEIFFDKKKLSHEIPFLSSYMIKIIKNILLKNKCNLPKLSEVYLEHSIIIIEFIKYFNKINYSRIKSISIT